MEFGYCPRCGGRCDMKSGHRVCQACSLTTYDNPKPCAAVVVTDAAGRYLLIERAVEPAKGAYDLPGGFVDPDETFEECAVRELQEEVGCQVEDMKYLGSYTEDYGFGGVTYPTLTACFTGRLPAGQVPKAADDAASCTFFAASDLPRDKFAFGMMNEVFRNLGI